MRGVFGDTLPNENKEDNEDDNIVKFMDQPVKLQTDQVPVTAEEDLPF